MCKDWLLWVAPLLWRSELRNVLATAVREGGLLLETARELMEVGIENMWNGEYEARSAEVFRPAAESGCSAYDCEFVAMAMELDVPLLTADSRLANAFGPTAGRLIDLR